MFQHHPPAGIDALVDVIDRIVTAKQPNRRLHERYRAMSADRLRLTLRGSVAWADAVHARFAYARLLLESASGRSRPELGRAVIATAEALIALNGGRDARPGDRAAVVDATALLTNPVAKPPPFLNRLNAEREKVKGVPRSPWEEALGVPESDFRAAARQIGEILHPPVDQQLAVLAESAPRNAESTAALLLRGAREQAAGDGDDIGATDMSQSRIRIAGVTLSDFRGVGSELGMDFRRKGRPASVLIFGDNGVGKSSLVDGIEFALQGRVGRSHDFDSSFAPVLRNLNTERQAVATVELSDGTVVSRTLEHNDQGRLVADGAPPTAGFRWAPITLKRSDLLRFLDTDPLSRGAVFFDYFPGDAERMGVRPEERQVLFQDELFAARVRRKTLATDLSERLGVPFELVETAEALKKTLRDRVFGGLNQEQAVQEGVWDRLDQDLRDLIGTLQHALSDYRRAKKGIEQAGNMLNPITYHREAAQLRHVMTEVGAELTTSFLKVTKADYVREIHVLAGESGPVSLDMVVELNNGEKVFPQQIFSEGYRDLLALLFFLAVARASVERGQARVLALDDVFQSVDAGVRLGLMAHVLEQFADWQLIVTIHDQLWYQQLRSLMQKRGHDFTEHRLIDWTFRDGPRLSTATPSPLAGVDAALAGENPALAVGAAGHLLERIGSEMSWRFRISVQRTEGDRYTLGDLWPGLVKALRRSSIEALIREIDDVSALRNLAGAHYNPYAEALSWGEARSFAQNARTLFLALNCHRCGEWVTRRGPDATCRCRTTSVTWS
ncbi:AAA family ATPase [Actinoplanes sp. HUAS TT8]|uniref:AAA family ATPase n=1 Tax=Actinoplanes sp. HUAS TT8 TaxID=3447453 RepID=UPI003F527948